MSRFSGKCDLCDHIAGSGGWYDKDGNPVKFGQEGVSVYYSDEMKDFEAFKKATGGILHQHHLVKVTKYNREFVKKHCGNFDYDDSDGSYTYFGTKYDSLKALNKHGVYIDVEIKFETILDLIPYYPYLVSFACCSDGKSVVGISKQNYVDTEFDEHVQYGIGIEMAAFYKKELQKHYLEVCRNYLLKDYDARKTVVEIVNLTKTDDGYELSVEEPIDANHEISFDFPKEMGRVPHWASPKVKDGHTIVISREDVEHYLTKEINDGTIKVSYIKRLPEENVHAK